MTASNRNERLCIWAGPLFMVLFGISFLVIAGIIPPPNPGASAEATVRMYTEHQGRIRAGLVLGTFAAAMTFPWAAGIAEQLERIEGPRSPMARVQLASGLTVSLIFLFPIMAMATAAFRPQDRPATTTAAFNDFAWLSLVGIATPLIVQAAATGIAILSDERAQPLLPRWLGYLSIWCAILYLPGVVVMCFHSGPLAWNGLLAFWIPIGAYAVWVAAMTIEMLKSVNVAEPRPEQIDTSSPEELGVRNLDSLVRRVRRAGHRG
jgi:hypothetical protein